MPRVLPRVHFENSGTSKTDGVPLIRGSLSARGDDFYLVMDAYMSGAQAIITPQMGGRRVTPNIMTYATNCNSTMGLKPWFGTKRLE